MKVALCGSQTSTKQDEGLIMGSKNIGSKFDDFLEEEGFLEPEKSSVSLQELQNAVRRRFWR